MIIKATMIPSWQYFSHFQNFLSLTCHQKVSFSNGVLLNKPATPAASLLFFLFNTSMHLKKKIQWIS